MTKEETLEKAREWYTDRCPHPLTDEDGGIILTLAEFAHSLQEDYFKLSLPAPIPDGAFLVKEVPGKDLKVGDEIWWDDENKFIAITEEYLKEALAFAKEEVEKSTYLVRTSIPQQDKWSRINTKPRKTKSK